MSDDRMPGTQDQVTHQLGEVAGILRMTVVGLENVRQSVERLTERAAFKADVEALRHDMEREIGAINAGREKDKTDINKLVNELQRWMWVCVGGASIVAVILGMIDFGFKLSIAS